MSTATDRSFVGSCSTQTLIDLSVLQLRIAQWVVDRLGVDHLTPRERAMRLFEDAAELAQAEGIGEDQALAQVRHVFRRPAGTPRQEAGGVALCLFAWCAASPADFISVVSDELLRAEAKTADEIRGGLTRKADDDLITCL